MELDYDPFASFGLHLAATRRKVGVSQETLAYESGMSRSYLSEVERGLRNIALRNICILAKTLDLAPAELLKFERVPVDHAQQPAITGAGRGGSGRREPRGAGSRRGGKEGR